MFAFDKIYKHCCLILVNLNIFFGLILIIHMMVSFPPLILHIAKNKLVGGGTKKHSIKTLFIHTLKNNVIKKHRFGYVFATNSAMYMQYKTWLSQEIQCTSMGNYCQFYYRLHQ